jgi:hypothetical protein
MQTLGYHDDDIYLRSCASRRLLQHRSQLFGNNNSAIIKHLALNVFYCSIRVCVCGWIGLSDAHVNALFRWKTRSIWDGQWRHSYGRHFNNWRHIDWIFHSRQPRALVRMDNLKPYRLVFFDQILDQHQRARELVQIATDNCLTRSGGGNLHRIETGMSGGYSPAHVNDRNRNKLFEASWDRRQNGAARTRDHINAAYVGTTATAECRTPSRTPMPKVQDDTTPFAPAYFDLPILRLSKRTTNDIVIVTI